MIERYWQAGVSVETTGDRVRARLAKQERLNIEDKLDLLEGS